MLGGDPESDVSRAHARELLETASSPSAGELVAAAPAGAKRTRRR
jgi:hypothetical protein